MRAAQSRVNKVSSFSAQKNTMFFQPSSQAISSKKGKSVLKHSFDSFDSPYCNFNIFICLGKRYNDSHQKNHENDDSINEMEDVLPGMLVHY